MTRAHIYFILGAAILSIAANLALSGCLGGAMMLTGFKKEPCPPPTTTCTPRTP